MLYTKAMVSVWVRSDLFKDNSTLIKMQHQNVCFQFISHFVARWHNTTGYNWCSEVCRTHLLLRNLLTETTTPAANNNNATVLVHFIHKCSSSTASTTPPVVTRVFQRGLTTQRRVGALQEPGHNSERYFSSHAENASSRYITDGRSQRPEHKETYILQKIDFSVLIH